LSLPVASADATEQAQDADVHITSCLNLDVLLYTYLHPLLGSDGVSGESWQLVTAICDEGDGLTLCG
jgi:hypothetical protein